MDSNIGKKLDGRYEITELIGVGGMADVYKAMDVMENRVVAVKILKPELAENEEFLRRFRNESKAIAVLSHPNIVKIYDVGFTDEIQFIVMEYIDGITLKEFIEQQGVLKWKDALHFVTQILRALQHAHDKGIVHRDIKPQNIMLFTDGTIKVMDFGIARFSRIDGKTLSDKTIGSVHYISPEQARGDMTDERSDIYSVGVMLYEMLTGKKPFDGDNPVAIALKHMQENAVMPSEIMPSIPEALEEIVVHAMERNPADRYQSAAEMIKDIDTFKLNQSVVFGYTHYDNPPVDNYYNQPADEYYNDDDADNGYNDNIDDNDTDDDDEYEEDNKKRSYIVPILLAVTVAVVITAAVIIVVFLANSLGTGKTHTGTVDIDNYVGQNITTVREELKDKLEINVTEEYNDTYEEGVVFEQDLQAGSTVKEGNEITFKVSKGIQKATVPEMAGKNHSVAESELKAAGFTANLISVYDENVAEGLVIKTEPASGTEFGIGSSVTVFVSNGPMETKVKVPDLVGLTEEDAIATLKKSKLNADTKAIAHEGDKGKVIEQSVEADTRVDRDTTVTIYVSTGEVDPVDVQFNLPIPSTARGSYKLTIYVNGESKYTQSIDKAQTLPGYVTVTVNGKKTETLTIDVLNTESNQSIQYAVYEINYTDGTATLSGSLNEEGIKSITPASATTTTTATEAPAQTEETTTTTAAPADDNT